MIYAFVGNDREKIHHTATKWIAAAQKKEPALTYMRYTSDTIAPIHVEEALGGQSLFAGKLLISLDEVATSPQGEFILDLLSELQESSNVFTLIESDLSEKEQARIENVAEKVFAYNKKDTGPDWSMFAVGNALARGDAQAAWVAYCKSRRSGVDAEVLGGIIHSKIRKHIAQGTSTLSPARAQALSTNFISRYGLARDGEWELDESIEHFLLTEVGGQV